MQAADLPRIADIIPPDAPEQTMSLLSFSAMSVIVFIVLILLYFLLRGSHHLQLLRIKRQLKTQKISARQAALNIRVLLRSHQIECDIKDHQSQALCIQLQQACFSRTPPDRQAVEDIIQQSRQCLRHSHG